MTQTPHPLPFSITPTTLFQSQLQADPIYQKKAQGFPCTLTELLASSPAASEGMTQNRSSSYIIYYLYHIDIYMHYIYTCVPHLSSQSFKKEILLSRDLTFLFR